MTADAVTFGSRLATHITKKMLYETQFYVSEGNFDRLKKRALAILAKHGGSIDRSTLLKNLHVDAGTMKRIVATLFMCELIESEMLSDGKLVYHLRNAA